ncbi:MAG: DNA polymerase III subunit alpha [bacterium]|nr:DNA polymerase III subunit alpha [bacterium]
MSKKKYYHLRVRSDYSILSAVPTVEELVDFASDMGVEKLALTDLGVMFGAFQFQSKCQDCNPSIRPIHGIEICLKRNEIGKTFQVIIFPKTEVGYRTICKMTDNYFRDVKHLPPLCLPVTDLFEHAEQFVVLSGFEDSEFYPHLLNGDFQAAKKIVQEWHSIFGDDFYIELQDLGREEDKIMFDEVFRLSQDTGIKAVITNPVYYLKKEDAIALELLKFIDQKVKVTNFLEHYQPETNQAYFKTEEEMYSFFKGYEEQLERTVEIAEKLHFQLQTQTPQMPNFPIPQDYSPENLEYFEKYGNTIELIDYYFIDQVIKGLLHRKKVITEEYKKRIDKEIDVIVTKKFSRYYLVVADFIHAARKNNILVGPGRGSVAGSLAAYALSITHLDPIEYKLIFERFLNPDRASAPDMDIDFADSRRKEVIDYVKAKYGEEVVCKVTAFNRMKLKAAIKDVGRIFNLQEVQLNKYSNLFSKVEPPEDLGHDLSIQEAIELSEELKNSYKNDEVFRKVVDFAKYIQGRIRGITTHAAGVLIAPTKISDFIPVYRVDELTLLSQFDKDVIESAGLLKMDMLGLTMLTVIDDTLHLIRSNPQYKDLLDDNGQFDLNKIPLDDSKTYELFGQGKTNGIFQFESNGMKKWLVQLKPNRLEDLIAMNALFRPGPMAEIPNYIQSKHGKKEITYLHPLLEPILKDTYGVIVYQEHVMQIAVDVAGFTMSEADILRKVISKKKKSDLNKHLENKFIQGAIKNGLTEDQAKTLFDLIEKFSNYGFNKSHSAGYAYLAYLTGYLKAHFPKEYLAAALTRNSSKPDRLKTLISEVRQLNVELLPPDINDSDVHFKPLQKGIRYGLGAIKQVGEKTARSVIEEREKKGKYKSFSDFILRNVPSNCNRKVVEALIKSGALDQFGERASLLATLDEMISYCSKKRLHHASEIVFTEDETFQIAEPKLRNVTSASLKQLLEWELEFLFYYASGHPLEDYKLELDLFTDSYLVDGTSWNKKRIKMGCIIKSKNLRTNQKNGNNYGVLTIEDYFGDHGDVFVNDTKLNLIKDVNVGDYVFIEAIGNYSDNDRFIRMFLEKIIPLTEVLNKFTKSVRIELLIDEINEDFLLRFQNFVYQNDGDVELELVIRDQDNIGRQFILHSENLKIQLNKHSYNILKSFSSQGKVELLRY